MPPVLATLLSATLTGITGRLVRVEVDVAPGLPGFTIVGLPDAALSEARERVRGALRNAGYHHPPRRITVNLAPAELRKAGASLDLAIAIGILLGSEQLRAAPGRVALIGELGLGGEVRPVPGILPMGLALGAAGVRRVIVPAAAVEEAALVPGPRGRGRRDRHGGGRGGARAPRTRRPRAGAAAAGGRTGRERRGRSDAVRPVRRCGLRAARGGPRGRARARPSRDARSRSPSRAGTRCC